MKDETNDINNFQNVSKNFDFFPENTYFSNILISKRNDSRGYKFTVLTKIQLYMGCNKNEVCNQKS